MIDIAQGLLVAVIVVLTTLLVVIGIQVVNILKEFKRSIEKINKILEDAGVISGAVAKPMSDFSGFFEGVKGGFKIVEWLVDFIKERKKTKPPKQEEPRKEKQVEKQVEKQEKSSPRRFFIKKGKKLA